VNVPSTGADVITTCTADVVTVFDPVGCAIEDATTRRHLSPALGDTPCSTGLDLVVDPRGSDDLVGSVAGDVTGA